MTDTARDQTDSGGRPPSPRWLALAAGLALLALVVSGYLSVQSLLGKNAAGCGGDAGCGAVLASPWAKVGPMPVSVLGCAVYLLILLGLGLRLTSRGRSKLADTLLLASVPSLLGAAGWYTYIQLFEIKAICPYCMADHGLGVILGGTLLIGLLGKSAVRPAIPLCLGIIGVGLLVLVQTVVPTIDPSHGTKNLQADQDYDRVVDERREVGMFGGELQIVLQDGPYLGDPKAPQVIGLVFDYCCPHCREMHALIEQVLREQGGFVIVPLPISIAPEHNEYLNSLNDRFLESYDLALLSLAVAAIDHAKWREFHHWLFTAEDYRTADEARAKASELVGQDALEAQITGDAADQYRAIISRNIKLLSLIPPQDRRIPVTTSPGAKQHRTERFYDPAALHELLDEAAASLENTAK